jgi:hypothetical protein
MDYPFTTDGCSGLFMRVVHSYWRHTGRRKLSDDVTALCVIHDHTYHPGGTAVQRAIADAILMSGIAKLGQPFLSRWMVFGLGFGGHPLLPFPWRWGYGWRYPRGYDANNNS